MNTIRAEKYQSYGNDFLIISSEQLSLGDYSRFCVSICDRHLGVGADGCIVVGEISRNVVPVRIFNRDGSEAGMSGNGCRCGCAFLHRHQRVHGPEVKLRTPSGMKYFSLLGEEPGVWRYRARMGAPSFQPDVIPFRADPLPGQIVRYPLEVAGDKLAITALWVGNPQCVVMVEKLPGPEELERWGSGLENHVCFPEKTNVSFVRVVDSQIIDVHIWERGVGPTGSSGTGCCGAAVAALHMGLVNSPVEVRTPGGSQQVAWEPGSEMVLTGEVRLVADVEFHWSGND